MQMQQHAVLEHDMWSVIKYRILESIDQVLPKLEVQCGTIRYLVRKSGLLQARVNTLSSLDDGLEQRLADMHCADGC